jgi:hypothetical protein
MAKTLPMFEVLTNRAEESVINDNSRLLMCLEGELAECEGDGGGSL